jgi:hypothetical protein
VWAYAESRSGLGTSTSGGLMTASKTLGSGQPATIHTHASWAVEDLARGVRHPVYADRFQIGGALRDDLFLPDLRPGALTLMFHANGEIWMGTEDTCRQVRIGEPFEVDGAMFAVRALGDAASPPVRHVETAYPYVITAHMHADCAPFALVEDPLSRAHHRLGGGGASAVLMYLLARRRLEDQRAGVSAPDAGWFDQRDLCREIWGFGSREAPLERLELILRLVRRDLRDAGLDPWFLEQRIGAVRIRGRELLVDAQMDADDEPTDPEIDIVSIFGRLDHDQADALWGADDPTDPICAW